MNTARTEQTVIVTHQQVTLYLCQCIKYYTDKNQQRCSTEELRERILNIQQACQSRHDSDESDKQ